MCVNTGLICSVLKMVFEEYFVFVGFIFSVMSVGFAIYRLGCCVVIEFICGVLTIGFVSWMLRDFVDFLSVIQATSILFGIIFFIIQKRIENSCADAKEGLKLLSNFESALRKFIWVRREKRDEINQAALDVCFAYRQLYDVLLLLRRDKRIHKPSLEEINKILNSDIYKPFRVIDVFQVLDEKWPGKKAESFEGIKNLREILLKIYEIR